MDHSITGGLNAATDKIMPDIAETMSRLHKDLSHQYGQGYAGNVMLHACLRILGLHSVNMIASSIEDAPPGGTPEWNKKFQPIYDEICAIVSDNLGPCFAKHVVNGSVFVLKKDPPKEEEKKPEIPEVVDWDIAKKEEDLIEKAAEELGLDKRRLSMACRINNSAIAASATTTSLLHEICKREKYDPAGLWLAFLSSMASCIFACVRDSYGNKHLGYFVKLLGNSISGLLEKFGVLLSMQVLEKDEKEEGS